MHNPHDHNRHRFTDVEKVLSPLWWMAVGAGICLGGGVGVVKLIKNKI